MFSLKDQKVVVIGAGSGIGAAVATSSAAMGASVVLAGRTVEKLRRVQQTIGDTAQVAIEVVDVADEDSVSDLMDRIGQFDHLILTAKPAAPSAPLAELTRASIDPILGTKFLGAVYTLKHATRALRRGGSITLVSGVAGWRPGANATILSAVNGGLASLAMSAALDLAPSRVNVIAPGVVDTPTWAGMPEDRRTAFFAATAAKLPVGRIGRPEDIAQAAIFLMSNGYTTGTVIHVDGGALLV
ncbi:SDR family oxidoreductase [Singulisphaera sp. Ch08]|uniref:SDR family oxidoreductase n=1 Tax=Singulisphaera sp. Ch08 TaxID=3120278 RepID=A0AAU7C8F6_9BACT